MGNACAGPQQRAGRCRAAAGGCALTRGYSRRSGPLPVLRAQPSQATPYAATAASAAQACYDPHYEAQLQQAIQQSREVGPSLLPRQADDDAAVLAAIAASEAERRACACKEEQDAELQEALRASEREMSVVPSDFNGGPQGSRAFADDPFADNPFADEPQPQPAKRRRPRSNSTRSRPSGRRLAQRRRRRAHKVSSRQQVTNFSTTWRHLSCRQ